MYPHVARRRPWSEHDLCAVEVAVRGVERRDEREAPAFANQRPHGDLRKSL